MADANKLKQGQQAFKTLCAMLDEIEWHYKKDEENLRITSSAKGDDLPIDINFSVDVERQLIMFLSKMPFTIPESRRVALAIAVSAANFPMVDGSFDYNFSEGLIYFRLTSSFRESLLSKELFKYMLMVSCNTIDEYNDKFLLISKNEMTHEEIIEFLK